MADIHNTLARDPAMGPEYTPAQPSRVQHLALRAGGVLMGRGWRADPAETLEAIATRVGGFEPVDSPLHGYEFVVPDIAPKITMSASDETTKSSRLYGYASGGEMEAATGTDLAGAAILTVKGLIKNGPLASTVRGRAARRLANAGTGKGHLVHQVLGK